MRAWLILCAHALASWVDSFGDDRHLTTDPACQHHRAPRPGSSLDRASRGVSCVPCMRAAAWGALRCFTLPKGSGR